MNDKGYQAIGLHGIGEPKVNNWKVGILLYKASCQEDAGICAGQDESIDQQWDGP